jgi:hypothetical protein
MFNRLGEGSEIIRSRFFAVSSSNIDSRQAWQSQISLETEKKNGEVVVS